MGQYYRPTSIDKKQALYSHNYDNGLKLMEHSYIGNNFMQAVENLLKNGGEWYKTRIVWAGDYADEEKGTSTKTNPNGRNLYSKFHDDKYTIKPPSVALPKSFKFLCNYSKKEYVNLSKVEYMTAKWSLDEKGKPCYRIHPLPLLTCEGNGRGGGDFHGEDERVGTWARDIIGIEEKAPKGFVEINGTFNEVE